MCRWSYSLDSVLSPKGIVRFASSMTGDELTPARQRPQGMYEGFTTAYGVVSEVCTCTIVGRFWMLCKCG